MAQQKNRFADILLGPHPRLLKAEDRRGARLFAALALIDAILTGVALLCINFMYTALQGRSIWEGQDSRIVIASAAIISRRTFSGGSHSEGQHPTLRGAGDFQNGYRKTGVAKPSVTGFVTSLAMGVPPARREGEFFLDS
jgi:hypothetical protein